MKRSTSRILTTHTGSLPRSTGLQESLLTREEQRELDPEALAKEVREAVAQVVIKQRDLGLDVINDGEQGRSQYATYVKETLTGYEGERAIRARPRLDDIDFPEWAAQRSHQSSTTMPQPACTGPIAWKDWPSVQKSIDDFKDAMSGVQVEEVFMTAASPGVIANFLPNEYYPSEEAYLYALADVMKDEYNAIASSGVLLQLDCPDLAMTRVTQFSHLSQEEFVKVVELHVEVINYALAGIPPEQMRLHLCWGNTEGPHHHDVPLKEIIHIVLKARPNGLSFEGANPRHAHEWKLWEDVKLPEGKVLIPGVLDSTTNFIEHPELVAERIVRYAQLVGRENVIAGTDCGFGTSAWGRKVETNIVWAKLQAMSEGARLASQELW
ncbi:MAG: cobalamin-independent methionine synthase II family protein [Chloroflexi bacterium]|nr:cobalamin-independent methionine synthase II family protein [Chloroflexota bacterium]MCI0781039.1 cobalamin-independent methionine synthase II family protein [Chloroflexota bacterium]MCI0787105.1 cobalamin-independent methionine synthase II family protein [Chloroflexota bacterium]MCI0793691.1 cobalamin-independent methionine synthase II family protein [Chloroflexota bacterium]MCI0798494.1 cobalamin-independent methionine synthase II family protein [Chloroflexota bacterium]